MAIAIIVALRVSPDEETTETTSGCCRAIVWEKRLMTAVSDAECMSRSRSGEQKVPKYLDTHVLGGRGATRVVRRASGHARGYLGTRYLMLAVCYESVDAGVAWW